MTPKTIDAFVDSETTGDDDTSSMGVQLAPDDRLAAQLSRALSPRIEILRRLAGGGMSDVYLGREPGLRRLVAIKVLSRELGNDPVARARFTREAEAAAAIVDPHVIEIYQVGTLPRNQRPYIIMQFVDGLTLQQEILTGRAVGEPVAKAIIGEVASALGAAHARGVVHRDIKPANIVLDSETGRAVVLDFGISAALKQEDDDEKLTMQGVSVGTPAYMSPEQAAAKEVSDKSDVYSLGVVAFELVTGHLPFNADAPEGYLAAHLQETPPDVKTLRPDLDKQFANLINRCLAKDPAARPAADEIARAYIPSARMNVEWPPPGLTELRGMGWKQLRTLVLTAAVGLAFFALLFFAPGSEALRQLTRPRVPLPLPDTGNAFTGGGAQTVWLFLLAAAILATVPLTAIARFRGWRLVALLKWARGLGYPWPVLIDVTLDGPDTAALVNGYGVFALASERKRRLFLTLKRLSAAAILLSVFLAVLGPTLWVAGVGLGGVGSTALISNVDAMLIFLPAAVAMIASALLLLPEWIVRNQARHWKRSFGLALPSIRPELVRGWLKGVGRDPAPPEGKFKRWVASLVPVAAGGLLSTVLLAVLTLTLLVIVTTSLWTDAGRSVVDEASSEARVFTDWTRARAAAARATRAIRPTRTGLDRNALLTLMRLGPDEARPGPRGSNASVRNTSVWGMLPGTLPDSIRQRLTNDTTGPGIALWRAMARQRAARAFWVYEEGFSGVASPTASLPMLSRPTVLGLAAGNEAAALLAMADGDTDAAGLRVRENLAVGNLLLRDPVNGWLAADVIEHGARMLRNVGLITENRALLREAEGLDQAVTDAGANHGQHLRYGAFLMADPVSPVGLPLVSDSTKLPSARWWIAAGIVPGFCGNAREVLFGVDPRRGELLDEAEELMADIPLTDQWVALNRRWLEDWVAGIPERDRSVDPAALQPLRWIRLGGLADRIGFCRAETG